MALTPEGLSQIAAHTNEQRELPKIEREQLAEFVADTVYVCRDTGYRSLSDVLQKIPQENQFTLMKEMQAISEETGWLLAQNAVEDLLRFRQYWEDEHEDKDEVPHFYRQFAVMPENLRSVVDFRDGTICYWIPRKSDILSFVELAQVLHEKEGKKGKIKILDVGGGAGFLGKLIADELNSQHIEAEVIVTDPNSKVVEEAQRVYRETANLKLESLTALEALKKYGPDLSAGEWQKVEDLEKNLLDLVERPRQELTVIRAVLDSLETLEDVSLVVEGLYGQKARVVLNDLRWLDFTKNADVEKLREQLAEAYAQKQLRYADAIKLIRDQKEQIFVSKAGDNKVDLVINSWMPYNLDLTREIRCFLAPAIVYIRERGGASGVYDVSDAPIDLGLEASYATGGQYKSNWDLDWEGISAADVGHILGAQNQHDRHRALEYSNRVNIQSRKDLTIAAEDLKVSLETDQIPYAWEKSLDELIASASFE